MAIDSQHEEAAIDEAAPPGRARRRFAYLLIALLVVLLLAFIPPLINVSHFQRRVDTNISAALGRPVHFDRLSLNLLPMPGFTLENFVIEEDPAFGYEPTLHADEVRINLRLSSLWRRRIEFSSISFTDPSVNLVHSADGRWNLQSLLLQASRIPAAPTGQPHPGAAPRFPYIQATGARVDLKIGQEKTPVALTEADFALWQPAEHQWRLRLEAHPVRTDIAPGESGALRVEGTLGGGGDHSELSSLPLDLQATWQDAQLGGLTTLLLGRDAGLRGDLAASLTVLGTVGRNGITASLTVANARRADFIPPHPLSLSVSCRAAAESSFHSFPSIECRLPPAGSSSQAMLALAASVPDVRDLGLSSVRLDVPALPSQTLFDWLGVATPHPPTAFAGRGTLSGALEWGTPAGSTAPELLSAPDGPPAWNGELKLSGEWLNLPAFGPEGVPLEDVVLRSSPSPAPPAQGARAAAMHAGQSSSHDSFDLLPVAVPLGGGHPAALTGHVDDLGYSLHLAGPIALDQLFTLGDAIPQFGDGLKTLLAPQDSTPGASADETETAAPPARGRRVAQTKLPPAQVPPVPLDLSATRTWGGAQIWTESVPVAPPKRHRKG